MDKQPPNFFFFFFGLSALWQHYKIGRHSGNDDSKLSEASKVRPQKVIELYIFFMKKQGYSSKEVLDNMFTNLPGKHETLKQICELLGQKLPENFS